MNTPKITEYYEQDHDRLDGLFQEYQRLKRTDYAKAKESFKQFKFGLQRHIIWEEEILFPLFEQKTGMKDGPTTVMRSEHRLIGKFLEAIHEKVKVRNPETDEDEAKLLEVLGMHNQKEERILYPAIDRSIVEKERDAVYSAMNALPEERYASCCHPAGEKSS
jgi:iron-sulfur cluster repair protein YtfE (RIC family)